MKGLSSYLALNYKVQKAYSDVDFTYKWLFTNRNDLEALQLRLRALLRGIGAWAWYRESYGLLYPVAYGTSVHISPVRLRSGAREQSQPDIGVPSPSPAHNFHREERLRNHPDDLRGATR